MLHEKLGVKLEVESSLGAVYFNMIINWENQNYLNYWNCNQGLTDNQKLIQR